MIDCTYCNDLGWYDRNGYTYRCSYCSLESGESCNVSLKGKPGLDLATFLAYGKDRQTAVVRLAGNEHTVCISKVFPNDESTERGPGIVAYTRKSPDRPDDTANSLERQRDLILDYCRVHGLAPIVWVTDEDVSGYSEAKRPGWQQVLAYLRTGMVTHLIATDLSRLHRRAREAIAFAEDWLARPGVNLVLLHEQVDWTTAAGKLQYQILVAANEFHRNSTSDKTRSALKRKKARGEKIGGHVPYGYRAVERDGKLMLEPDEAEQRALAYMRELRARGADLEAIASALNAAGVPTKQPGSMWWRTTVARLLKATAG